MKHASFGKVILTGEHSAVYGHPAVAAAVNLSVSVSISNTPRSVPFLENIKTLFSAQFHVDCSDIFFETSGDLPSSTGLGSSAAVAYATLQALAEHFSLVIEPNKMIALIKESERFAHGHPSGLDAATVVHRGMISFRRNGDELEIEKLPPQLLRTQKFFLVQSGVPEESTKDMLEIVRRRLPQLQNTLQNMGELTSQFIANYQKGSLSFEWMDENEKYLEEIGVVGETAKKIIRDLWTEGAHAKVTGAGGVQKGSGVILVHHEDQEKILHSFKKLALPYMQIQLGVT